MRQQLVTSRGQRSCGGIEKAGEHAWRRSRRSQLKKTEEREFFRSLSSFKLSKQVDLSTEGFKQKVMTGYYSGCVEGQERYLDEWTVERRDKGAGGRPSTGSQRD